MDSATFLQDLAVVLLAAGAAAFLFTRLGLPPVVGYILAGLLLGPNTPPFALVSNQATIRLLADLGLVFLMFSLGLEFNLRRLRRVGAPAGLTAVLDVTVMVCLGYLLGKAFGWTGIESLFLGCLICDSSTTILAKTLQEMGRLRDPFAGLVIGITVIEDVLAVILIGVLTGLAMTGTVQADQVAFKLWELVLFLITVAVAGLLTLPRLLRYLVRFDNDELLLLVLLGICFGVTLIGVKLELSLALGAVMVGAIAAESGAIGRLDRLIEPLRHVFSAVFFVAVGLMLDPAMMLQHAKPILAVTALVIVGKFFTNTLGALLTGRDMPNAIRTGAGLAQIGEFALIICSLGLTLGATRAAFYPIGVSAALLTTLISPFLLKAADRLAGHMERDRGWKRWTRPFRLYGQLVERASQGKPDTVIRRAVRRSIWIMIINTILFAGALAGAGYLARHSTALPPFLSDRPELLPSILWLTAMIACLPLTVATLRKLQALGMILAETALPENSPSPWARSLRGFLANAVLAAGSIVLALLTFLLSYTLLPGRILLLLSAGTAIIAFWRWPRLVKVYSQAQLALKEVLADDGKPDPDAPRAHVDVTVVSADLPALSVLVGEALVDIRLRSRTGATVVAIERKGRTLTNPDPGERLHAGDRLFLLGDAEQIRKVLALVKEEKDEAG